MTENHTGPGCFDIQCTYNVFHVILFPFKILKTPTQCEFTLVQEQFCREALPDTTNLCIKPQSLTVLSTW